MPDTENFIRIRLRDPQQFDEGLWTSEVKKTKPRVNAVMGALKGTKTHEVQAFLFPREDGWSVIEAQKWSRERVTSKKEYPVDEIKGHDLPAVVVDDLTVALSEIVLKDATSTIRHKFFQVETKIADREAHEVDIIISSDIVDRDKELVVPAGLVVESSKIPLVAGHGHGDLRKHIGQVLGAAPNGKLVTAKGKYLAGKGNPEADWAWILANEGLGNYSIGFIPKEYEDADLGNDKIRKAVAEGVLPLRKYTKWELVEVSQVIVPSNKLATQRLRESGVIDEKTYEVIVKGMPDEPLPADQEQNLMKLITEYNQMRKTETSDILAMFHVEGKEGKNMSDEIVLSEEEKKAVLEAALADKVEKAKAAKKPKDDAKNGDDNGNGKGGDDDEDELDENEKSKALKEAAQAKAKARKEAEVKTAADLKAKQDAASPIEYLAAGHAERVSTALTHIGKGTEVLQNLMALQAGTGSPGGGGKQNANAPVNQQHTEVTAAGPTGKPRKDGEEVVEVKGEVTVNAEALLKGLEQLRVTMIKEIDELFTKRLAEGKLVLPADSAAFASAKDIISAVMTGVKEQIDQRIKKAIADPSAYRQKA
jgi:hypothetical protein